MSVSKMFTNYAVKLLTKTAQGVAGAVYVDGVQDLTLNSQLQTRVLGGDGSAYNTFGALVSGAPTAQFTALALKKFLDACGLTGMLVDADATYPGVVLYFQRNKQGGTREAQDASNHFSVTVANGLLVPRSLSLPHQGEAALQAELFAIKSGSTEPLVFSAAADLPASVYPSVDAVHTLGPVKFNAATIDGLDNANIDFGLDVAVEARDSDVYPTFVYIRRIQPTITLSGVHADVLSTLTPDGKYYTAQQVIVYGRKRAEGGTFEADATAEHLKFTLGKCRVDWESVQGDPKQINMRLQPWYTAGASPVSPLAISTAAQIT